MAASDPLADHIPFQTFRLLIENISLWQIMALGLLIWALSNKERLQSFGNWLTTTLKSIKIGNFEAEFKEAERAANELMAESENQAEYENSELSELIAEIDPNAPSASFSAARDRLKQISSGNVDRTQILAGLTPEASAVDFYASAEILRQKRDLSYYDDVVETVARLAESPRLEGKRYMFVWALASALHRMTLFAVKTHQRPLLSVDQLRTAREAAQKLHDNPHVQNDSPNKPKRGIRGPAQYTVNWAETGLAKLALGA
ncbi:hypothetical protein [Pseudophaeobacter sp.]|uniref:hypothetical protein n=1 Tax=Pseudophaeobacter sp. TaxID=1971739 RepID=UPI0032975E11